jgi:capsule polysaccharide modification protein KpsS
VKEAVLLLQGPVGPFFKRLAKEFEDGGCRVYKVNFNGGDEFFYRQPRAFAFAGRIEEWEGYLEELLSTLAVTRIYLFGAFRRHHAIASQVAARRGIPAVAFDEGYLRPDYITVEEVDANGCSQIPDGPGFYSALDRPVADRPARVPRAFTLMGAYAVLYYSAAWMSSARFPNYRHHRPFRCWSEGSKWLVSAYRKLRYHYAERRILKWLVRSYSRRYYLAPLQVHCDSQVLQQSSFCGVEDFIVHVTASFAAHAPPDTLLVFKHHPMDRGYCDYAVLIDLLARKHELSGRLIYVHDLHLPTLLDHARGTIVINSTVGLSSVLHGTPAITLGRAVYDRAGLTARASLQHFWKCPERVNARLFRRFRAYLVDHIQANGSFYRRLPHVRSATGVSWPANGRGLPGQRSRGSKQTPAGRTRPVTVLAGLE